MDRISMSAEHWIGVNARVGALLAAVALVVGLGGGACKRRANTSGGAAGSMDRPMDPSLARVAPRPMRRPPSRMAPGGANPRINPPRRVAKPKPKPLPKAALQPSVKRPSYGVLKRLAKDSNLGPLRVWGHGTSLGGTRFLAVVVGNVRGAKSFRFKLVMLHKPGQTWQLGWSVELPMTRPSFYPAGGEGAASLFVGDYDWDGKPEALVRYRYDTKPEPAVGSTEYTDLAIVNVDGARPRVAFVSDFHRKPQASTLERVKGRLKHVDLNGDGHPDLQITSITTQDVPAGDGFKKQRTTAQVRRLWDPASDTYK